MSVTPNNATRKRIEEQFIYDRLSYLCTFICNNYEKIIQELSTITKILSVAETCSIAYSRSDMIASHINASVPKVDNENLTFIAKRLSTINEGADLEFFQNVNFLSIIEELISKDNIADVIIFIWNAQKILVHISYQLDRIKNASDMDKKVAILKGMIALY